MQSNSVQTRSPEDSPRATLDRWFATLDPNLLAENVSWNISPGYPVPRTQYTSRGDVFENFFPELRIHFSEWIVEASRFTELGDKVVVEGRYVGTVKVNAAPIEVEFIHVWTVQGGVITELCAVADTAQFAKHGLRGSL